MEALNHSSIQIMQLCIAEKPSVAREIAKILGAKSKQEGYLEGNGYCVTWTFGHLCTLKEPEDYKPAWKKWNINTLPILPERYDIKLIRRKGISKQFQIIKRLCRQANVVINCGDAGQEGELIQRWVLQHAGYRGKVLRLWIASLTPEAIRNGFRNLKNGSDYDRLFYAGRSRAIGDWMLGMNATRLFTLRYGGFKQVLSIGRVQTPTLAMLVERHKEIAHFVPEPYWELHTLYREVDFQYIKGRFMKKEDGEQLLQQVIGHPFTIVSSEKKRGNELPPKLFDLTGLQVHCNKRFSYSADQTLKIVQQLYEKKLVTYPRVDTTYLPNDMYPKISGILGKLTNYSQFTQPLLQSGKKIRKSGKVFNDKKVTDHHAIIPTGIQKGLMGNEANVYDAITRRFIAAFYPDCIFAKTTVIGESNKVQFKTTGKEILEEGWRVLYPKPKHNQVASTSGSSRLSKSSSTNKDKKQEEVVLPIFKQGETGEHQPSLIQKMTQPPKYYTEATLLRSMETAGKQVDDDELRELMKANGIGRPSTRANIIETLFRRKYIHRKKKQIHATPMGIQLIDTIKNDLLKSAELTGQWEKQLRDIEAGSYSDKAFMQDMEKLVRQLIQEVQQDQDGARIAKTNPNTSHYTNSNKSTNNVAPKRPVKNKSKIDHITKATCPKCQQGSLLKGKAAYGCSRWKEGCSFRLPFVYQEKALPEKQLLRLVENGSTIQLSGFKLNNQKDTVKGKLYFDENFQLHLKVKPAPQLSKNKASSTPTSTNRSSNTTVPDVVICPKCKIGEVIKGNTAYGCSRWREGCGFRVPFTTVREQLGNRRATKENVFKILTSFKQN